jgi:(S)-citramalyl-CoA lyase
LVNRLDKPILPLIETAEGLTDLASIVSVDRVVRLLLGMIDLALDLGIDADHRAGAAMLDAARYQLVIAPAARHLPRPIDGVFTCLANEEGLRAFAISVWAG